MLVKLDRVLSLLVTSGRDVPERQRTIRATVEWSIDLLSPFARALFVRLGVFTGDFSLDAVEAVTADEPIFRVADLSTVWVEVAVYAKDLGVVRQGQEAVVVSTDLGAEATGRINFIGRLVGEQTRSATARLTLPNADGRWRPGLFVTVRLVREETTVPLAVSTDAIQTFRDWQVAFVKYGDEFEARPLELGRSDGEWVEVVSGLKAGDQYAAANSFAVKAEIGKLGATHDH